MTLNNQKFNATIMVVDDTPANLNLIRDMLQERGYRVLAFPNGRMALNAVTKSPPDIILLDIMMPEMDGFEVARRLKTDETLQEIPILFVSALGDAVDKVKAFSAGGVGYITKPFQFEEVQARVETHLRLRRMSLELERHNLHLEELVKEKVKQITDSQLATILVVTKLADYRDDDTGQHIERTRTFCKILAEQLRHNSPYEKDINDDFVETIFQAAPMHDIGKVGISDSILLKPGKLSAEEFEIMKTHTVIGEKALQATRTMDLNNAFVNMGLSVACTHHEKWDGTGYPKGLAGEDIPLVGRIMALADVYDALRSKRPYKESFSHEKSREIILEGAGKHFDPRVIDAFKVVESRFAVIFEQMVDGGEEV